MSESTIQSPERRHWLKLGWSGFLSMVSLGFLGAGFLRMPMPVLLPGPSQRVKIGNKDDYPVGTVRYVDSGRFFVFSDDKGIYAISALCTHLGCIVKSDKDGFICPCHGSRYDAKGKVTKGPAPKSLAWHPVHRSPGGQLLVDVSQTVDPGTKLV